VPAGSLPLFQNLGPKFLNPMSKQEKKNERKRNLQIYCSGSHSSMQINTMPRYSGIRYNTCFVVGIKYLVYNVCYTGTYTTMVLSKRKMFSIYIVSSKSPAFWSPYDIALHSVYII